MGSQRNTAAWVAVQDSDWIDVCCWGNASGPSVCGRVKDQLYDLHGIDSVVLPVYGSDFAVRVRAWTHLPMVCIGRPGSTQTVRQGIAKEGSVQGFMLADVELEDISSTVIRQAITSSDWAVLDRCLPPSVLTYLCTVVHPELRRPA
eukprot:NODE_1394_length_626_cov_1377.410745_g988_i0.p2 GENE.NODE_1394_length_626_cov_1377.410745_g988_i0~~NODE_1394_length_626_cov_1377.410745_g988_i0.p2  ORF type:complete len:158 (-),score=81.97 NODE_1394_length_626_cov_1377.410745_g988_i0:152-592(-)